MEDFVFIAFRKNVKKKGKIERGRRRNREREGDSRKGRRQEEERGVEIDNLQCRSTYVRDRSF